MSSLLNRPSSLIGKGVERLDAGGLLAGHGTYVDDMKLPRMVHACFVRSPHAHARIVSIDTTAAKAGAGVITVLTGPDFIDHVVPWKGVLTHMPSMKSATQFPLAIKKATWQGEPVAVVVAKSRALAEDAAELVEIDWEPLPVVATMDAALASDGPIIHAELGDNICFSRAGETDGIDQVFEQADHVLEETFNVERQTPVTLEPRSILADYNPGKIFLNVYMSSQVPHMMQYLYAKHLGIPETNIRVQVPDMGGGYGLKIHIYGDETATTALSIMLGRPVKHVADRIESFISDNHSREHRVKVRLAVNQEGDFLAWDVDDLCGAGAYSVYPRGSVNETKHVFNLTGGPYASKFHRGRSQVVFQNKAALGQYRAVGHPVACVATEGMVDRAAQALKIDPADIRRRNYIDETSCPYKLPSGSVLETLSQQACLDRVLEMMDYPALRAEQDQLREKRIYRGIGLASYLQGSSPSSSTYGMGGAPITSQDGCTVALAAQGTFTCAISVVEIGQGARTITAQIVASVLGVGMDQIAVKLGDTDTTPYGAGNWGSRGAGTGGETAFKAARALRENILNVAAFLLQEDTATLDIQDSQIIDANGGTIRMSLEELAYKVYFRTDLFPKDFHPELSATQNYAQKDFDAIVTNGIQGAYLEVDVETGFVKLLRHWVVHDCGTVINPDLVGEQIRGAVVQGLGAALGETCLYSSEGQLMNGNLADYLVPMAVEMPDIDVDLVSTPTQVSELGAKGAAEAGTAGAPAAVMNGINDALSPFETKLSTQPFTPERIYQALNA
ncbi:MAG: xanthine dehydrogenase family protein molybdopterin-binding subunit [Rhodospirillales bacterium]|nr:xanthine dehydrogenase family protein molybdopterin-binding subunit [Rhodospirillales bacterium]